VQGIFALIVVTIVVFAMLRMAGDPVILLLPPDAPSSEEFITQYRESLGLNDPLLVQYARFAKNAIIGDFGTSIRRGRPAMSMVLERFPATLELTIAALISALIFGILIGSVAAFVKGTWIDQLSTIVILFGQSFPNFWLGLMLILVFAVKLGLVPPSGRLQFNSFILPTVTLAAYPLAQIALLVRVGMIDILSRDFIMVARSKGLTESQVLSRHALKNVAIPVVTMMGLQARYLIAGSIIVETVFAWPGLGMLTIQAVDTRDFPVLQATVFFIAILVILINLFVDVLYAYLDPRVKYG
jgi:peptide/nickel transport system permease protein